MPEPVPANLNWQNIEAIWKAIQHAKSTKDPQEWEDVVASVAAALEDWKRVVNKWPELVKKFHLMVAHAKRIADPEKKQATLDAIQNIRDQMPRNIRDAVDAGKPLVPVKLETIGNLMNSLEGIRQGDTDAYAGSVKKEMEHWYQLQQQEQHQLKMFRANLLERLHGVQDPEKRKVLGDRLQQIERDKREWGFEMDKPETTPDQKKRYETYIKNLDKEVTSIYRRLKGAKGDETKAKLEVLLRETEAKMKTDEQLRQALQMKSLEGRYDALMWLVTNIAHPVKVLHTKRSEVEKPIGKAYAPPKPPESVMPDDETEVELERPPKDVGECRILTTLIAEGQYEAAKKFWVNQYGLSVGDFVMLENNLKGRVRLVENRTIVVDLFKNDIIKETAVRVAFNKVQPYL